MLLMLVKRTFHTKVAKFTKLSYRASCLCRRCVFEQIALHPFTPDLGDLSSVWKSWVLIVYGTSPHPLLTASAAAAAAAATAKKCSLAL